MRFHSLVFLRLLQFFFLLVAGRQWHQFLHLLHCTEWSRPVSFMQQTLQLNTQSCCPPSCDGWGLGRGPGLASIPALISKMETSPAGKYWSEAIKIPGVGRALCQNLWEGCRGGAGRLCSHWRWLAGTPRAGSSLIFDLVAGRVEGFIEVAGGDVVNYEGGSGSVLDDGGAGCGVVDDGRRCWTSWPDLKKVELDVRSPA